MFYLTILNLPSILLPSLFSSFVLLIDSIGVESTDDLNHGIPIEMCHFKKCKVKKFAPLDFQNILNQSRL